MENRAGFSFQASGNDIYHLVWAWNKQVGRVDTDGEPMAGVLEGVDESDDFTSLRVLVTDGTSSMQDEQMADLEAELEAELDYLTGQFPDESEVES